MKFGIIGAGMIAEFHAKAIAALPGAELAAVYARRDEAANHLAAPYGARAYTDLDAFLANEGLDIVTICTPRRSNSGRSSSHRRNSATQ